MLNNVANAVRHYKETGKRNVACEVPFAEAPVQELLEAIAGTADTPGTQALIQERDDALRRALEQLPETDRQVIQWRNYELLPFEEIGVRLGKSAEAARKGAGFTWCANSAAAGMVSCSQPMSPSESPLELP